MSDMSQYEDGMSASREFANPRYSVLLASAANMAVAACPNSVGAGSAEMIAGLIHDTRNMVMALELYCGLLDEPGVLLPRFQHYAGELRLVSGASRRMLETLDRLSSTAKRSSVEPTTSAQELSVLNLLNFPDVSREPEIADSEVRSGVKRAVDSGPDRAPSNAFQPIRRGSNFNSEPLTAPPQASMEWVPGSQASADTKPSGLRFPGSTPVEPDRILGWSGRSTYSRMPPGSISDQHIDDLAADLRANHNLLSALAGPGVTVSIAISGGRKPVMMAPEDLTRVLVNLVRNAVEAMPGGGVLEIVLEEGPQFLALSFADTGPGIPREVLDRVFSPGYSSHPGTGRDHISPNDQVQVPKADPGPDQEERSIPSANSLAPVLPEGNDSAPAIAWPIQHRGLGLSIVRAIVTAAGGAVWASNRTAHIAGTPSLAAPQTGESVSAQTRAADRAAPSQEIRSQGAIIHIEFPLSTSNQRT